MTLYRMDAVLAGDLDLMVRPMLAAVKQEKLAAAR